MGNKNMKKKYLFAQCDEIFRPIYEVQREFSFNDFDNVFYETGKENAEAIFEANGVPEEFRKVVIKVNIPQLFGYEAEDYLTGYPFDITGYTRFKRKDDIKYICGQGLYKKLNEYVSFKTLFDFKSYYDVIAFYNRIKDAGLSEEYVKSVSQFFAHVPVCDIKGDNITYSLNKNNTN